MSKRPWLALVAAALLGAAAQDAVQDLPADTKVFWNDYWAAKQADQEDGMDKAVRNHRAIAERVLGILLDDYCQHANPALPDELRALAWSMDRVDRHEKFIGRVRFVLDLDADGRKERYSLFQREYAAEVALDAALKEPKDDAYQRVTTEFIRVADGFEKLGEPEYAIFALQNAASIEQRRNRLWERAGLLERIVKLAATLSWSEIEWEEAADELKSLRSQGYDPDKPKGTDAPASGAAASGSGGAAAPTPMEKKDQLESYASGSELLKFKLTPESAKRGLTQLVLPTFLPQDNFFLWPFSELKGNGPSPFDTQRSLHLEVGGKRWNLTREATKYSLDTDGDGKTEITFTPSNVPELIEVPVAGGRTYPLMVCVPSDREQQYGMDVNYEPQPDFARLRFAPGGGLRGDVQGESWLVVDNNMSGIYGDVVDEWGDGVTPSEPGEESFFREADAILVGKSKTAMPWSSVLPLGDGFFRAAMTPDGTELSLRKLQLETGQVKLDCATKVQPTHVLIEEVGGALPGAIFNVVPAKRGGTVTVPVGSWRFVMGRLEAGAKTTMQQARIYRGHAQPFDVKAGQTATLSLGAPYSLRLKPSADDIKTDEEGETTLAFWSMRIFGRGGEEYAQIYDEPLQPELEILGPDGKKIGKPHKTSVADVSVWQKFGDKALFFPVPLALTLPKGKLVYRLSQSKAHGLLGGPFVPEEAPKPAGGKP